MSATHWQIDVDTIHLANGLYKSETEQSAIVDTGTSLLVGPKAQVGQIAQSYSAKSSFTGQYTVNCQTVDSLPNLVLTIAGQTA
jgi:Eukaryotic aspartyl protease